jgi:hypothetical protein
MFWIKAGGLSTLVYFAPTLTQHIRPRSTATDEAEPQACA